MVIKFSIFYNFRAPADILNVGQNKVKRQAMDRPSDKLASLTPVIRIFGNVTNTVTATDIPKAYKRQIENFEAMQEQAKNLEEELNKRKQIADDYEVKLAEVIINNSGAFSSFFSPRLALRVMALSPNF